MKILQVFILAIVFTNLCLAAGCPEPDLKQTGPVLATRLFTVASDSDDREIILRFDAAAAGTSWDRKDSEAAVVTVFIDGTYHQEVILFTGSAKFRYDALLGRLAPGRHRMEIALNRKQSARQHGMVSIRNIEISSRDISNDLDSLALANTPFIYLRPDTVGRFSDVPLLTFYEVLSAGGNSARIRYTTVFSNEDGGTQTAALLARWGRTTDIEWIYEIEAANGRIVNETFQGANHITTGFAGERLFGNHPVLYDVTANNNFADRGCSEIRIGQVPVRTDLSRGSRETTMDKAGWIYRIMAQEMVREGRVRPNEPGPSTMADPRDYVFFEVYQQPEQAALAVEATDAAGKQYHSDGKNPALRVERSGYSRIALLLPRSARREEPVDFALVCYSKEAQINGVCRGAAVLKVITLDNRYRPRESGIIGSPKDLQAGQRLRFSVRPN